jgi:hypothetical protein
MSQDGVVITVEVRVLGRRKPALASRRIQLSALPPDANRVLRLRDLLTCVVRDEVRSCERRQEEHRLIRVLSPDQLDRAALTGKIISGGRGEAAAPVDEDAAVAMALQAFVDGLYFVFLDGTQQQDLGAEVTLRPESTMTFVRLVALAGG